MKFKEVKLSELIINYDKKRKPLSTMQRVNLKGIYPYYGAQEIIDYINDYIFDGKYILLAEDGENLRSRNKPLVKIVNGQFWLNNHAHIFQTKDNVDLNYLFYYLLKFDYAPYITGSTQPKLNQENMNNIIVRIPNFENQLRTSYILTTIDEKIELNNQINNNLYEIMCLKFNEWIDNLDDYELSNLSSIAIYKNGLAMQKFRPENEIGLPVIKIKEMNSGISSETERCKSDIDQDVIVNNGDVLFAWSGTLCMTIWDNGKAGLNQHIFKVTSDKYPKWFYYFWTLKHLDKFIQIAAGKATTMGHIKRGELDLAEVLIPNSKALENMNNIMTPMLDKFIQNKIENRTLEQLRDTLLPKLMNGEIDLDNIEI